jgi:hypothetical protein
VLSHKNKVANVTSEVSAVMNAFEIGDGDGFRIKVTQPAGTGMIITPPGHKNWQKLLKPESLGHFF